MNSTDSYHILWIDDEWEKMTSFKTYCQNVYNMELHPFKTQKEGLDDYEKHPDFYEAAILDAKVLNEGENEVADVESLIYARDRINKEFPDLVHFVSTGQPDLLSDEMFKKICHDEYYEKGTEDDELCQKIIEEIKDKPNRQIINKYSKLFNELEDIDIRSEMLNILKIYENNEYTNADAFNKIRKVYDWVMQKISDYGLLATRFSGSNLNDCSKFLGKKDLIPYVPIYIQRNLHSLSEISNEGSHRQKIDQDVKSGIAPYLISSTIFELINVLIWVHHLPQDPKTKNDIEKLKAKLALDNKSQEDAKKRYKK